MTPALKDILILQTGFIGDIILSTPVISAARMLYPDASITFLTTPLGRDLVQHHPELKEVITYDKRKAQSGFRGLLTLASTLRKHRFDGAFSLHKSLRSGALLSLSRIPLRVGFQESPARWLWTHRSPRKDLPHEVLRNLAIFRSVGHEPSTLPQAIEIYTSPADEHRAASLLSPAGGTPIIGIAPGSVWATKRWTVEGFSELARACLNRGYRVILIGGKDDSAIGEQIESETEGKVTNLIGQLSLTESFAVIKNLSLLVANDSAPLHLASAAKIPAVALFCATVPEFGYGPWQNPHRVLGVTGLSCRPCGRHGGHTCPTGTHACQRELKPSSVMTAVSELLAQ